MFTKILYINLDRRPDRKEHIDNQLKLINWTGNTERISGIDGRILNIDNIKHLISNRASLEAKNTEKINFAPGSYMTKGAVGCALSHREAWLSIMNGNDDKVLVLEDDVYFDDKFNERLSEYLQNIPEYDLLYIGYHETWNKEKINEHYRIPNNVVFGLYGYVVDKKITKQLLDMFPIEGQIDSEIKKIYPNIKVFHVNEDQRIIHSDHSFNNSLGTDIQVIEGYQNINKTNNEFFYVIMFLIILFLIHLYIIKSKIM
jgi:hypothetical protein